MLKILKNTRRFLSLIAVLCLSFTLFGSQVWASPLINENVVSDEDQTKKEKLTDKQEKQIRSVKKNYPNKDTQKKLIEKVKKGEIFDSINPEKRHLGKTKNLFTDTTDTTITEFPDGSITKDSIDFSEATFYDENGKKVENPFITPKTSDNIAINSISGGTWSSGSGYKCVRGAKVDHDNYSQYGASFKAGWCHVTGGYDYITNIYETAVWSDFEFDIINSGVFRTKETLDYTAYGGIKFSVKPSETSGMSTEYLYLRVAKDTYYQSDSY